MTLISSTEDIRVLICYLGQEKLRQQGKILAGLE